MIRKIGQEALRINRKMKITPSGTERGIYGSKELPILRDRLHSQQSMVEFEILTRENFETLV